MPTAAASTQLAIEGGAPARTAPFPAWPYFAQDEISAVERVMRSGKVNYWTGNEGRDFEREFAAWLGVTHAVALANGTVALELALAVLGIGAGDDVVTTSRTFIASASCAVMRGARPVICDVDRDSGNMTAETIRAALTPATKAIIVVHLGGWPCEMGPIMQLARERGILVIEDCAQAHGARYNSQLVGTFGHIAAWSFCQDKIMTTLGEGGMITMNDDALWAKAWAFKDHGKSYDAVYNREHAPGFRWLHESFGTNWRLTEAQSAVGRVQLRKLPEWLLLRRSHAGLLQKRLSQFSALRVPMPPPNSEGAFYKFYCYVKPERLRDSWSRDRIMQAITAEGVPCFSGSCSEIYLEKAFPQEWRPAERLPIAKEVGETSLMFLVHPTLATTHIEQTCDAVEKVLAVAAL